MNEAGAPVSRKRHNGNTFTAKVGLVTGVLPVVPGHSCRARGEGFTGGPDPRLGGDEPGIMSRLRRQQVHCLPKDPTRTARIPLECSEAAG